MRTGKIEALGNMSVAGSFTQKTKNADLIESYVTITVGTGGDYSTINAALAAIAHKKTTYVTNHGQIGVRLLLKAGFVMTEQVYVENQDLSWITIEGEDAETVINITTLGPIPMNGTIWTTCGLFNCIRGKLPVIGQLFTVQGTGSSSGYHGIYLWNSYAWIKRYKGIKNCKGSGLIAGDNSTVFAQYANFSGATGYAVLASNQSFIDVAYADLKNSASDAGSATIEADSGSYVHAPAADLSGPTVAGDTGIIVNASTVICNSATITNKTYGIKAASGSIVIATGVNIEATNTCVQGYYQCVIQLGNSTLSGGSYGLNMSCGGTAYISGAAIVNFTNTGVYASDGPCIAGGSGSITGATGALYCINAGYQGFVQVTSTTLSNAQSGVYATFNSLVEARYSNFNNINHICAYAQAASTIDISNSSNSGTIFPDTFFVGASYSSTMEASGCTFNGNGTTANGANSSVLSHIDLYNSNVRRTLGSNSSNDMVVENAGIINARIATGGVNQTINTLTTNGIIFQ